MERNCEQMLDSPSKNSYIGSYYQPPDPLLPVSRQLDFPDGPVSIIAPPASSRNTPRLTPGLDSKAVVDALTRLQDKIRKLEGERKRAEKSEQQLSLPSPHTAGLADKDNPPTKGKELDSKVEVAVARCQLLEKQLVYMTKMVEQAKKEDRAPMENQSHASNSQSQREKLEKLESKWVQLSKTQSLAERKLAVLEIKLQKEEHERKLVQEKAEELQRELDGSLRLFTPKTKKTKKTCGGSDLSRQTKMPFVAGTSTSPSHSVHANVQSLLHMMKHHHPQLCERLRRLQVTGVRVRKDLQNNVSEPSLRPLADLLLALQDELGQMSFECQEVKALIDVTEDEEERKELHKELEKLLDRMEEKGVQISTLRKHQHDVHKLAGKQRSAEQPSGTSGTSGVSPPAPSPLKPKEKKGGANENLQLLRETQKLRNRLKQDDVSWET